MGWYLPRVADMGQLRASNVPERRVGIHHYLGQVVPERGELCGGRVQHPPPLRQDRVEPLKGQVRERGTEREVDR